MALQFHRVIEKMEIWSANSDGYSFAISFFDSFTGPGFKCRPGYVASWRPLYRGRGGIKIIGYRLSLSTRPKSPAMRC